MKIRIHDELNYPFSSIEKELFIRAHADIKSIHLAHSDSINTIDLIRKISKYLHLTGLYTLYDEKSKYILDRKLTDIQWMGLHTLVILTVSALNQYSDNIIYYKPGNHIETPFSTTLTTLVKVLDYLCGKIFYVNEIEYSVWFNIYHNILGSILCPDVGARVFFNENIYISLELVKNLLSQDNIKDIYRIILIESDEPSKYALSLGDLDYRDEFGYTVYDILDSLKRTIVFDKEIDDDMYHINEDVTGILKCNTNIINYTNYDKMVKKYTDEKKT
jgi:hypothetical protein